MPQYIDWASTRGHGLGCKGEQGSGILATPGAQLGGALSGKRSQKGTKMPVTSQLPKWKKDRETWLAMVSEQLNTHEPDGDHEFVNKVASTLAESAREGSGGQCVAGPALISSRLKVEISEVEAALEKLEKLGVVSEYNPSGFQGNEANWKKVDINKGPGTRLLVCHERSGSAHAAA
jgi:hypothetical protein